MRRKFTVDEIEFIKNNYHKFGGKYCSEKLSVNANSVASVARRLGIKVSNDILQSNRFQEKCLISLDDYINVKNYRIAYILGLIWADGYISFSNNRSKTPIVKHSCVKYDSEVCESIFKELNWRTFDSENYKSIGKNTMVISWLSSRPLGEYLISENYREKQKGTFIYRKFPKLKSHFLRGFFDGDGCLSISNCKKKYKQISVYFSSSVHQDWLFLTNILDEINVEYQKRELTDNLGKSSQLCIRKSESIYNLCEFMYKDSENNRLERKFEKYIEFLDYKKIYHRNNKIFSLLSN